jgi:hypothetical protein
MKLSRFYGIVVLMIILSMLALFPGCGKKKEESPDGSTIVFNPATYTQTGISSDTVVNVSLVVRYPDGTPMPKASVKISGAFAVPRATSRYQFYFYPDAFQNPNNLPVDSGFFAQTDDFGTYNFSVAIFSQATLSNGAVVTNAFGDNINATSGSAFGTMRIDLN